MTATDEAGNASVPSAGLNITIDTTAPAAPVITTTTALTNDNTPTIEGSAEAGSRVELLNGNNVLGSVIAGNDGSFSITSSVLADASYTLTVTATDEAGNNSVPSTGLPITIDTTAPAAPLITTSTSLTNINTPTIEGTAEAGSTVELFNGSDSLGTVIAADNGTFLFNSYGELIDGSYHLTATSTDTAGNISVSSHGLSIIVDTTEPDKPIIATTIATTNTDSPTIEGTTAPGTTVDFTRWK